MLDPRAHPPRRAAFLAMLLSAAAPAMAQDAPRDETVEFSASRVDLQRAAPDTRAGQTARSSVGQVGQRQTREQAAPSIEPMGRIASRVQNRIQSRIHNRIDRYYDPRANATSPFATAGEQARTAGRARRR